MALSRISSGGWPAAREADCLDRICGEPGMDCHSTFWPPFALPHSSKAPPTALSVTSFQLAENQTLNTPAVTFGSAAGAAAAGAAVAAGAAAGAAGFAASAGLLSAGLVSAGLEGAGVDC